MGTTNYVYDNNGNPKTVSHLSGVTEGFTYDGLNRVHLAYLNGAIAGTFSWDTLSRRQFLTYGDGSTVAYGYDNADRLTSLNHVFPNGVGSNVNFTYGYDNANRLNAKSVSNPAFADTPPAASVAYGTANALNQYPSVGGQTLGYNSDGTL